MKNYRDITLESKFTVDEIGSSLNIQDLIDELAEMLECPEDILFFNNVNEVRVVSVLDGYEVIVNYGVNGWTSDIDAIISLVKRLLKGYDETKIIFYFNYEKDLDCLYV